VGKIVGLFNAEMFVYMYIIITGKIALFEPYPSLEYSARVHLAFTFFDFAAIIFLQSKFFSLAFNPQPGAPGVCLYVPP
jgi:hypothetical protein